MSDKESGAEEVTVLMLEHAGSEGAWVRLVYERKQATGAVNGRCVVRIIEGVGEASTLPETNHWWEQGEDFKVAQEPAWR